MRYPDHNYVDGMRALKIIGKHLHEGGRTLLTQARMLDDPIDAPRSVTLPAFTPFSVDGGVWAAEWAVPRTMKDFDEVVSVYEEYADRKLGKFRNPCKVARATFQASSSGRYFGPARRPWDWWVPAAKLVALAAYKVKTPATVQPSRVLLEVGGYRLEVTRRGCYSNFRRRVVEAPVFAEDARSDLLTIGALTTSHPLAVALVTGNEPEFVLWAANAALRSQAVGRMAPITAQSIAYDPPRTRGKGIKRHSEADFRGALHACRDTLENADAGIMRELYHNAVPILMTTKEFSEVLASPWSNPGRKLGPGAVQRMLDTLDQLEREL